MMWETLNNLWNFGGGVYLVYFLCKGVFVCNKL
jgi:hypothetical protein